MAKYLTDHTISNIDNNLYIITYYRGLANISSPLAKEILNGIAGGTYNLGGPFIIMPVELKLILIQLLFIRRSKQT